jgi:hypothetical protein
VKKIYGKSTPRKLGDSLLDNLFNFIRLALSVYGSITPKHLKTHVAGIWVRKLESGEFKILFAKEMHVESLSVGVNETLTLGLSQNKFADDNVLLVPYMQLEGMPAGGISYFLNGKFSDPGIQEKAKDAKNEQNQIIEDVNMNK